MGLWTFPLFLLSLSLSLKNSKLSRNKLLARCFKIKVECRYEGFSVVVLVTGSEDILVTF
jgi:hypothetical protein